MTDRIDRGELIARVVERTGNSPKTVEKIVDATFEEIYEAIKRGERVTLPNFGLAPLLPVISIPDPVASNPSAWLGEFAPDRAPLA